MNMFIFVCGFLPIREVALAANGMILVFLKLGGEKKRRETLKHLYDWRHVELAELAVRKF